MCTLLEIWSSSSPQSVHASVRTVLCTSALLESALQAAKDQAGWWEPEPCPLWIGTLCQSNPHQGLNELSSSPLPFNTMPWLVAHMPTALKCWYKRGSVDTLGFRDHIRRLTLDCIPWACGNLCLKLRTVEIIMPSPSWKLNSIVPLFHCLTTIKNYPEICSVWIVIDLCEC